MGRPLRLKPGQLASPALEALAEYAGKPRSKHERKAIELFSLLGLPLPAEEHRFARALDRQWKFDFAWPERMLAVECEGGIWSKGRHTRGGGYQDDCEKYSTAAALGWCVLRFTEKLLRDGTAAGLLERAWSLTQPNQRREA